MSSDYNDQVIVGVDPKTGYPLDEYGHLLSKPGEKIKIGSKARELTNPYGSLEFAIGSNDDFVCFDYNVIEDNRRVWVILHATVNSETGSFIDLFDYEVVPIGDAVQTAESMVSRAEDWICDGCDFNPIGHDKRGWNQDTRYFLRCVTLAVAARRGELIPVFSDRQKRFGGKKIDSFCGLF